MHERERKELPAPRRREGQTAQEEKGEGSKSEDELHTGPVPRICMDYFYLSNNCPGDRKCGQALSTKELQRQLRRMGKSDKGTRNELVKRYDRELPQEEDGGERDEDREREGRPMPPHASENPMMVMVDESTGNKYMRAVDHKGLEGQGDNSWLVRDMHEELKSWGYPGGGRNAIILKSDGEPAIVAVREAWQDAMGV